MKNKFGEIELLVKQYASDIAILSETWITKNETKFYNFKNYNSIYSCRKRQGGDLGIFIKKEIEYDIIENIESENISCIIVELTKLRFLIFAIYRPPSVSVNDFLNFLDKKLYTLNSNNCIIIGDINIDLLIKNNARERQKSIFISNNFYLCK